MPSKRRKGQTFLGFQAAEELVQLIDSARGYDDRSLFLRKAIANHLKEKGFSVPDDLIYPPARTGNRDNKYKAGKEDEIIEKSDLPEIFPKVIQGSGLGTFSHSPISLKNVGNNRAK